MAQGHCKTDQRVSPQPQSSEHQRLEPGSAGNRFHPPLLTCSACLPTSHLPLMFLSSLATGLACHPQTHHMETPVPCVTSPLEPADLPLGCCLCSPSNHFPGFLISFRSNDCQLPVGYLHLIDSFPLLLLSSLCLI